MTTLTKVESAPVMAHHPANLLQIAVEQNADIDKLDRLMTLQERWEAEQSRKAFSAALAGFQADLKPIVKTKQGHNSKYADANDIAKSIRPLMEKHGLSFTHVENQEKEGWVSVTCIIRHVAGHSESSTLSAGYDTSGGKNAIQAIASTVTYLRRYTLTGLLGITTGEDDQDGGRPAVTVDELLQYAQLLRDEWPTIATMKQGFIDRDFASAKEAWNELSNDIKSALWRAPSKGGIFTTQERDLMHSKEWSEA